MEKNSNKIGKAISIQTILMQRVKWKILSQILKSLKVCPRKWNKVRFKLIMKRNKTNFGRLAWGMKHILFKCLKNVSRNFVITLVMKIVKMPLKVLICHTYTIRMKTLKSWKDSIYIHKIMNLRLKMMIYSTKMWMFKIYLHWKVE